METNQAAVGVYLYLGLVWVAKMIFMIAQHNFAYFRLSLSVSDLEREFECFAVAMEQVCVKCFIKNLRAFSWCAKVLFSERVTFDTLHPSPLSLVSGPARSHFDLFRRPSFISTRARRQSASL
jgi:hypothetical protein